MPINDFFPILTPVVHPKNWDLIRVPLIRYEGEYKINLDDRMVRIYNDKTLPDAIKSKMAMILAHPHEVIHDNSIQRIDVYTNKQSPELDEIGWQSSEHYFCLVLNRATVNELKGSHDAMAQER